jgi:hypothetical protein
MQPLTCGPEADERPRSRRYAACRSTFSKRRSWDFGTPQKVPNHFIVRGIYIRSHEYGGGEGNLGGVRVGLGHRFAAAWVRVRCGRRLVTGSCYSRDDPDGLSAV